MTLREARIAFTICIAELILYAVPSGYEVALDEGLDRLTAKDPTSDHMIRSLHNNGLAQDLVMYRNGVYLTDTMEYAFLGQFWEELGKRKGLPLAWGGHFKDGNHFSLSWDGKR